MTNKKITDTLTDEAILAEMGERIARRRLELRLTQAALAREAGVAKRTLERVEAGATAQLTTIIRIFRVLDLLPILDQLLPKANPGPIEAITGKSSVRKRASSKRREATGKKAWTWDDN
jgi:transcriptional regulator with XRE-family HTH domain